VSRRASLLLGLVSIAIVVVALVVVADRQDDDGLFVAPTAVPSPSAPVGATAPPFSPPDTPALTSSPVGPAQDGTPVPAGTPFVVPTPTPTPDSTPIPDTAAATPDGPTPITGGGAIPGGMVVLLAAGFIRAAAGRLH